jgi:hypothetical protein
LVAPIAPLLQGIPLIVIASHCLYVTLLNLQPQSELWGQGFRPTPCALLTSWQGMEPSVVGFPIFPSGFHDSPEGQQLENMVGDGSASIVNVFTRKGRVCLADCEELIVV